MFIRQARQRTRTHYQLAITLKGDSGIIGTCGLRAEPQQQAYLGCGLAREKQVSGYAMEAMHALVQFGFYYLQLHRVYLETLTENRAAIALCKKSGLRSRNMPTSPVRLWRTEHSEPRHRLQVC
ncbi:MAG: GNAT family N-acetyltransferase [Pseudomonadales bacterium]|nr:GNAT family N-acetyltransferase [Pseudomonadales bacterium]NRA17731.1 GNAT family N-acetyltransferase [Oceanospirillaceae bacterium]